MKNEVPALAIGQGAMRQLQMIDQTIMDRLPWTITYEYRGFKIIYKNNQWRVACIYQGGQLRSWASDLEAAVQWIEDRAAPEDAAHA
jgi:hypothetical protein